MTVNRTTTAKKALKRRIVASGLVSGQSTKAIASDANTSQRNVQRIAAEPETQLLITAAFRPQQQKLLDMAERAVQVVQKGFEAMRCVKTGKDVWEWHGDALARLKAVERYGELLNLAQGKVVEKPVEAETKWTWEEFTAMYNARQIRAQTDPVVAEKVK